MSSRGWTYQEGYLSKRRLISTNNEILFPCNEELAKETGEDYHVDKYNAMDSKDKFSEGSLYYHEKHFTEYFLWMIPSTDCSVYWNLYEYLGPQIEEYSRRTLSHSEDGTQSLSWYPEV